MLDRILPMPERSVRTCPDLYVAALAQLYGLTECNDAPLSLWRKHAINCAWREVFATRVQESIDRHEVTMNVVAQHARRLGLVLDRANWRANAWWKQIGAAISDIVAVAVAFPHLGYLDYYRGLRDWLRTHAREHVHNDRVAIFEFTDARVPS